MIKRTKVVYLISALLIFTSCRKEIEYNGDDEDPQLVLNMIAEKDSTFKLSVEHSQFFLNENNGSNELTTGISATLNNLTTGSSETITTANAAGEFEFASLTTEAHEYSLSVTHAKYGTATSTMTAPSLVPLISVDTASYQDSEMGNSMRATLTWDDPSETNYYIVKLKIVSPIESWYPHIVSSDVSIYNSNAEMGSDSWLYFMALKDDTFNGQTKSLNITFNIDGDPSEYHFELYTCSKDAFEYFVSVEKEAESQNNPLAEPVKLHTNISDGYGIFGALSKSVIVK